MKENRAENWLVASVFANAILGGLLISRITENEVVGEIVMLAIFLFAVIMASITNHRRKIL